MAMTMVSLNAGLRIDLRDASDGQWSATDKYAALNSAIRRTAVQTKSYMTAVSNTVVSGTHTYDMSPIFLPVGVRLGDKLLDPQPMGGMAMLRHNWDADISTSAGTTQPHGIPTKWMPLGGHYLRVWQTPAATAAGIIGTVVAAPTAGGTGYVTGDTLTLTSNAGGDDNAQLYVVSVSGGAVTSVKLHSVTDNEGVLQYYRGTSYVIGEGQATTKITGAGTGCTVQIAALATLDVYGAAWIPPRGSGSIETLAAAPTAGGTGYEVNDVLTITEGAGGQAKVTTINNGVVTAVTLHAAGTGYTVATGKATGGGHGSGCTLSVTAIKDTSYDPIMEISDAFDYAIRLAAREECWRSRPWMPNSWEQANAFNAMWLQECERVKLALGLS